MKMLYKTKVDFLFNILQNLSHRMLHEVHSMDDERRLLKMLKQNKDIDSGFSLKQVEEQVKCKLIIHIL